MKAIKVATLTLMATVVVLGAFAQGTFFPTKAGSVQVYAQKNGKGKIEGHTRQTINDVQTSGGQIAVSYTFESLNKKLQPLDPEVKTPCKVTIKDDVVIMDLNQMFANAQSKQQNSPSPTIEISGVPMELPSKLKEGQALKDAEVAMSINLGFTTMKTVVNLTNGKCLAIEDITTPAGTFSCHKITQTCTTTLLGKKMVGRAISWYALGVGTIKTENYDDKEKLQSSMELIQLSL